jgi:hypothetical protein
VSALLAGPTYAPRNQENDMKTDTNESNCIVADPGGGDVGKRGAGLPASPDPLRSRDMTRFKRHIH